MINNYVSVYTDGACSGNPGPGSIGVLVLDENGQELESCKECIGDTTNNRAEYRALIKGLEIAAKHCRKKVICYSDNELMIKQLNKQYRIKKNELYVLCIEVNAKAQLFEEVIYQHVRRQNKYINKADKLAQEALSG